MAAAPNEEDYGIPSQEELLAQIGPDRPDEEVAAALEDLKKQHPQLFADDEDEYQALLRGLAKEDGFGDIT